MSIHSRIIKPAIFCVLVFTSLSGFAEPRLELTGVISTAIENDPWLRQSLLMQEALLEEPVAEGAFPDPRLAIGAANLPTDTFDIGQEPMTQATIGLTQRIPRGKSRQLLQDKKVEMAEVQPFRRENRRVQVVETVTYSGWRSGAPSRVSG